MLGANTALKMISRYSSGMEPQISMKRWNARSVLPPKKPWIAPVTTPSSAADDRQRQREQHADAKAVDQLRQQVAPPVVGAQPVVAPWARAGLGALAK